MREFAGDTWELLIEWGIWSREGRPSLLGNSPLLKLMAKPSAGRLPKINDDLALEVDGVVSRLKRRDDRLYGVIELTFIRGLGVKEIARRMGVSDRLIGKLLSGAVAWVDCGLHELPKAA